jgi:hypothetical protein
VGGIEDFVGHVVAPSSGELRDASGLDHGWQRAGGATRGLARRPGARRRAGPQWTSTDTKDA